MFCQSKWIFASRNMAFFSNWESWWGGTLQNTKNRKLLFVLILCFWSVKWQQAEFHDGCFWSSTFWCCQLFFSYILVPTYLRCKSLEVSMVQRVVKDLPIISTIFVKHGLFYPFLLILQDKGKDMYSSLGNRVVK